MSDSRKRKADENNDEGRKRRRVRSFEDELDDLRLTTLADYSRKEARIRRDHANPSDALRQLRIDTAARLARREARLSEFYDDAPIPERDPRQASSSPQSSSPLGPRQASSSPLGPRQLPQSAQAPNTPNIAATLNSMTLNAPVAIPPAPAVPQSQSAPAPLMYSRLHNLPLDVIFELRDTFDTSTRLSAAVAYPTIFLQPGLNVIDDDAQLQLGRIRVGPPGPGGFEDDAEPMLSSAIRDGHSLAVIRHIIDSYEAAFGGNHTIDDLYNYRPHDPPLFLAVQAARPDALRLLLERGLDINTAFSTDGCELDGLVHPSQDCIRGRGAIGCVTALNEALWLRWGRWERFRLEGFNEIREVLSLLCMAVIDRNPAAVQRIIVRLFQGPGDYTEIIRSLVQELMSRDATDPVRQSLENALPLIVQDIATSDLSVVFPEVTSEDVLENATARATEMMSAIARSDNIIRALVFRYNAAIEPGQLLQIAREGTPRSAVVILEALTQFPDNAGDEDDEEEDLGPDRPGRQFLLRLADRAFVSPEVGGWAAGLDNFLLNTLIPWLRHRGHGIVVRRLLYAAVRDRRDFADRLFELDLTLPTSRPIAQLWFYAIIHRDSNLIDTLMDANRINLQWNFNSLDRVDSGLPAGSTLETPDALAARDFSAVDVAILMNDYALATRFLEYSVLTVMESSATLRVNDTVRAQVMERFVELDPSRNPDPRTSAPLPIVVDQNLLPEDIIETLPAVDHHSTTRLVLALRDNNPAATSSRGPRRVLGRDPNLPSEDDSDDPAPRPAAHIPQLPQPPELSSDDELNDYFGTGSS